MPNARHEATLRIQLAQSHRASARIEAHSALLLGPLVALLIWYLPLEIQPAAQCALAVVAAFGLEKSLLPCFGRLLEVEHYLSTSREFM